MIFKLVINKECEESVCATVHERTPLIDEVERLVMQDAAVDKVVGYEEDTIVLVRIDNVELFYVENDKVFAHCSDNKTYRIKKTLTEIEKIVPGDFVRISKSGIANWSKVSKMNVQLSGAVNVFFRSGYSDYISRRCFADIKRRYGL
ncbi:MAG: LytTR family transcriptional regulator [Clostridia bacterium]|nr:LytTR family transcriptional regulator [Clostridia bacterium]